MLETVPRWGLGDVNPYRQKKRILPQSHTTFEGKEHVDVAKDAKFVKNDTTF